MSELPSEPNIDIANRILILRGERVLLDQDLALLYGVTIKRLNQQVRRNLEKFPNDFLFQLEPAEADSLRMHFATLKKSRGAHRKHAPLVFTEHGAIMAATVLSRLHRARRNHGRHCAQQSSCRANECLCRPSVREAEASLCVKCDHDAPARES
jgi:hypothetical protein